MIRPFGIVTGVVALMAVLPTVASADTQTIYVSRLQDGSLYMGDKPAQGGTDNVKRVYEKSTPAQRAAAAEQLAQLRRDSDAFDRRQAMNRAYAQPSGGGHGHYGQAMGYGGEQQMWYPAWGVRNAYPMVPSQSIQTPYTSSPGAVNGRGPGFIGSGFGSAR